MSQAILCDNCNSVIPGSKALVRMEVAGVVTEYTQIDSLGRRHNVTAPEILEACSIQCGIALLMQAVPLEASDR